MSAVSATAETIQPVQTSPAQQSGGCPVDHAALSQRKVARPAKPAAAIERDEKGVWHIHRCPGAYIAIQETDVLLHKLMAIDTLRIEKLPTVTWGDLSTGYELRNFILTA